jgi:hypothetical protein
MGAELFHVDRQTDMTKQTGTFCNFVNTPKKSGVRKWVKTVKPIYYIPIFMILHTYKIPAKCP